MPDPNGQGVKPPEGQPPAGTPPGTGAPAGGAVDQEFEITRPDGQKVKVKASDIIDESGVPFKNRAAENERRRREAEAEAEALRNAGGQQPQDQQPKEGEFIDPLDGKKYTQDDIDRMYMVGEGSKAHRIMNNQVNVDRVVDTVIQRRESRARVVTDFPDLQDPQSPFFRRVATYMSRNGLYENPNGLRWAARDVAEQMRKEGVPFKEGSPSSTPESQRQSQTRSGVQPGGDGQRGSDTKPVLDDEGVAFSRKLGVDPEKIAIRLQERLARGRNRRED